MPGEHFSPKLNKKRILSHNGCAAFAVNGLAVRNAAQPDEEFGNFATHDEYASLIPRGEVWVSEKLVPQEGLFFIANAVARMKRLADGQSFERAYEEGIEVERVLRERITGVAFRDGKPHARVPEAIYQERYATLPDNQGEVRVWIVDGNLVRSYYKTDYTEGGHGHVYPWVPRPEIWIDDGVDRRERVYIVSHEYLERRLMRDAGLDYDHAHEVCSAVEFRLRKGDKVKEFLAPGPRKLAKGDLPGLASQDLFEFVLEHFVKA